MEKMIRAAKAGEPDAFTRLMKSQMQSMYKTAGAILMNDEDIADAVSDTILTCWESIGCLREEKYFRTWMTRILINKCNDIIRRKKYILQADIPDKPYIDSGFENTEWKETINMVSDKYRLVLVLYYIEDFLYNSDKHIEDNYMKLQIFCGLHGVRIENIKKIFVLGLGFGDADLGYIKHLIYETQGISENPESYLEQEEKAYLDSLDYDGIMHINMQYAFSHRERVMQKKPISFPEHERLDEMVKPYVEDPYQHVERDVQLRLEAAGVRRRFREEQEERNQKIRREYLRMLNKRMHLGMLTPVEAFLEHDPKIPYDNSGTEWHISYYSEEDRKRIDTVMQSYGCENYTLHPDIAQCIETFKK